MTLYCPPLHNTGALLAPNDNGSSEAAAFVKHMIEEGLRHFAEPKVESLVAEIEQILDESSRGTHGDWVPVDIETARAAVKFAYLLPWSLPAPEIAPEADGEISFDWLGSSGKIFSVSVSKTGLIAYAGRFGEMSKVHGTEQLSEVCPNEIIRGIARATS
jgi:hypothetical protein